MSKGNGQLTSLADVRVLGWVLCGLAVVPLLYAGNPALALLVGGAIALGLNRQPIAAGGSAGKYCLQAAIVLLGLRLNLATLWQLSADYTWSVAVYVLSTLAVGLGLGRLLNVEPACSKLMSSGTAICGGTTIATLSTLVRAQPQQTGVALAIVFLLNAIALFTFPSIGHLLDLSQLQFGLWSALAIHDTSSVVATAAIYGEEAANVATTIKLGRTLWLIPLAIVVSLYENAGGGAGARVRVPGFILAFLGATALGSYFALPDWLVSSAGVLSKALLVVALFLVGTDLSRSTVRRIRGRVLGQALLLWMIVVPLTLGAIVWLV